MTAPADSFDEIPEQALAWYDSGKRAALATVIETWGSAPRPAGSQLAISGDGEIAGSVSGGCVEGAVIVEAQDAIADGRHRLLTYGVSDENAFEVGLACGGTIRILVEPISETGPGLTRAKLFEITRARAGRMVGASMSDTETGAHEVLVGSGQVASLNGELADLIKSEKPGMVAGKFVTLHLPPLRLVITGAVHIAQPLCIMAELAGFDVILIDPRPVFGSEQRFPGRNILDDWPDDALKALGPDRQTALITLTHDPKLDDPAIITSLRSDMFYIGCLGSKKTHAKRVKRLQDQGFSADSIARIHGPVGLNIGAKSPAEIAVSIMAELVQKIRRP